MFTLNNEFHSLIYNAIKLHLITVATVDNATTFKEVSEAYGDLLLRGWKDIGNSTARCIGSELPVKTKKGVVVEDPIGDDVIQSFESNVLGMLVHDAIHANNVKVFRGLFQILNFFHNEKNYKGMDNLLMKTYNPIIWRSLKCNNSMVRAQSAALFCAVFPLRANNTTAAEDDDTMQKHFNTFTLLLKDNDHKVRSSAISGICKVLNDYWEPIPANISYTILSYMINTSSKDCSSGLVRIAVIEGLQLLLTNCPLSHVILKKLLPSLSHALHDVSEKVRSAFVTLLLIVSFPLSLLHS